MRESPIQRDVKKHAEDTGWVAIKLDGGGSNGKPDMLFVGFSVTVFIEFKRPGQKPRKLQDWWHRQLRDAGATVHTVDAVDDGIEILDQYRKRRHT